MTSFFRHVVWSSLGQVASAASLLLVGVITARMLGPEGRGVYATFFFTAGLASTVCRLGIHEAITYLRNRESADAGVLLGNTLLYLGVCAFIVAAAAIVVWHLFGASAFFGLDASSVAGLTFVTLLLVIIETLSGFVMAEHKYNYYAFNNALQNAAILGVTLLLFAVPGATLDQVILWRIAATTMSLFVPVWFVARLARRDGLSLDFGVLRQQLRFGLQSTTQLVLALLNYRVYLYALVLFVGTDAAGAFSVALLYVELVRFAPNAIGLVLFPALTRDEDRTDLDRMMARVSRNLTFITGVTVVIAICLVPVATRLVFGLEYAGTVAGTQIMLIAAAVGVSYQIFSRYFTSRHMQRYNIGVACVGLFVALICSGILMPSLGFEGGALAFLVGHATSGILMVLLFIRLSHRPPSEVLLVTGSDLTYLRHSLQRLLVRAP